MEIDKGNEKQSHLNFYDTLFFLINFTYKQRITERYIRVPYVNPSYFIFFTSK